MDRLTDSIVRASREAELRRHALELLLAMCAVDTTPSADVTVMRDAESRVFDLIERDLRDLSLPGLRTERRPVNPAIASHPAYSQLHFTKTPERPEGLSPEQAYRDRANLLCFIPAPEGAPAGIAVNAHIDVVKPFSPPQERDGVVYGRGACDDKGGVVAFLTALRLLDGVLTPASLRPARPLTGMIVIEEETGGNGSLSLALDRDLRALYDELVVLECTNNDIHPANRGAVWYRARLAYPEVSLFELSAFVVEQLEREGRAIKAESRHALFPQRPVQTCHGILGPYGEHPSRICGHVAFMIRTGTAATPERTETVRDCIESALAEYVAVYGDKTRVADPATGKPKVERHYDLTPTADGFRCDVYGSTGHMGSILENDGAITKAAAFARALVRSRTRISAPGLPPATLRLGDGTGPEPEDLILEGGQGFVPTHPIREVMDRMERAARLGARQYLELQGMPTDDREPVAVTYEKLHNDAFDGDPESEPVLAAVRAAERTGMREAKPVVGWTVSCDARLFAGEYPDLAVITTGPGTLAHAHSDAEQLSLDELMKAAAFLAVHLLSRAGTVPAGIPPR